MLEILRGIIVIPKTPVEEVSTTGQLALPLVGEEVASMQVSSDGSLIAYIQKADQGEEATLRVNSLAPDSREVVNRVVVGDSLAWLGRSNILVYEDQGDIQVWDVQQGTQVNLTRSLEVDSDPLPSPDGRYILWTRYISGAQPDKSELWMMNSDGSNQAFLAPQADLVTWDRAGGKVISLQRAFTSSLDSDYHYYLQTTAPGKSGWDSYTECPQEVLYIWWPLEDQLFYLSPQLIKGEDVTRGVWVRVVDPDSFKKVASTDGLSADQTYYRFYPHRTEERLAYVGEKGLEYMDYKERTIYRYTVPDPRVPLAWNETGNQIYYCAPDGIYRVSTKEG